jgi:hypothetical protein
VTEINVSYRPTLGDVLHAARLGEGEMWKTASRLAAGVLFACAAGFFYVRMPVWGTIWLALGLAELFNLLPMSVPVAYLEYRRNPKYRQEYHLTLTPEHLAFRTETIDSTLRWEHYSRFWETKRAFVLAYGAGIPTIIPKAAFASQADLDAARAVLADAIARRPSRKSGAA